VSNCSMHHSLGIRPLFDAKNLFHPLEGLFRTVDCNVLKSAKPVWGHDFPTLRANVPYETHTLVAIIKYRFFQKVVPVCCSACFNRIVFDQMSPGPLLTFASVPNDDTYLRFGLSEIF